MFIKKRNIILLILGIILLASFITFKYYAQPSIISASMVDTKAVIHAFSVSVKIDADFPAVTIVDPLNGTYITNYGIPFNYSITDAGTVDTIWFNLDEGANQTINNNITLNASEGSHILYLFANDSANQESSANLSFYVNLTALNITSTKFLGDTTNLTFLAVESQLQNVQPVIEITNLGKIEFNESVNISNDADLDANIEIRNNNITIYTENILDFNKSATLFLYGLTFTNPRLLKDGAICPSSICTKLSYVDGNLIFNVTGFTSYTSEETPSAETGGAPAASGGGGGAKAGGAALRASFKVLPGTLRVLLKVDDVFRDTISVFNDGSKKLNFLVDLKNLEEIVSVSETEFTLEPNQKKEIGIRFDAKKTAPGIYLGRIFVISDEIQKMLSAIIEVESKAPFFDIILDIPQNYKEIFFQSPADLPLGVTLFNLGNIGETNVNLEYFVKDFEGNVILRESDIVTVDKQVSFTKTLKIPPFLRPGEYAIIVYARYGDGIGTASDLFGVTDKTAAVEAPLIVEFKGLTWIISILSLIVVIAIIFTLLQNYRLKNIEKSHPIVIKRYKSEAKKIQPMSEEAKKMQAKLTSHLGLLKKSYDAGYINQEAYDKAKSTIDGMLQKLK